MEHNYTQTQTHSKYSENGKLQANQYYQHQSSKQQPIAKTKKNTNKLQGCTLLFYEFSNWTDGQIVNNILYVPILFRIQYAIISVIPDN